MLTQSEPPMSPSASSRSDTVSLPTSPLLDNSVAGNAPKQVVPSSPLCPQSLLLTQEMSEHDNDNDEDNDNDNDEDNDGDNDNENIDGCSPSSDSEPSIDGSVSISAPPPSPLPLPQRRLANIKRNENLLRSLGLWSSPTPNPRQIPSEQVEVRRVKKLERELRNGVSRWLSGGLGGQMSSAPPKRTLRDVLDDFPHRKLEVKLLYSLLQRRGMGRMGAAMNPPKPVHVFGSDSFGTEIPPAAAPMTQGSGGKVEVLRAVLDVLHHDNSVSDRDDNVATNIEGGETPHPRSMSGVTTASVSLSSCDSVSDFLRSIVQSLTRDRTLSYWRQRAEYEGITSTPTAAAASKKRKFPVGPPPENIYFPASHTVGYALTSFVHVITKPLSRNHPPLVPRTTSTLKSESRTPLTAPPAYLILHLPPRPPQFLASVLPSLLILPSRSNLDLSIVVLEADAPVSVLVHYLKGQGCCSDHLLPPFFSYPQKNARTLITHTHHPPQKYNTKHEFNPPLMNFRGGPAA